MLMIIIKEQKASSHVATKGQKEGTVNSNTRVNLDSGSQYYMSITFQELELFKLSWKMIFPLSPKLTIPIFYSYWALECLS